MLVLTRRVGEKIVIGGTVVVTVLETQGEKVRLGVQAPASVTVDRLEIHQRRQEFAPRETRASAPEREVPLVEIRVPVTGAAFADSGEGRAWGG